MSAEVDIKQLAIRRDERAAAPVRRGRHVVSRYIVPGALLLGVLALVAWASRDVIRPPLEVTVVPVLATQAATESEGTPLFQAAGWIEPRPTPVRVAALAPGVVERLLVVEDQPVKAGEPVAELVRQDAKLAYDRAIANLKLREAELAEARAGLAAAETRLAQPVHLEAALGEAEAALAATATELINLPFELRRAKAQLEFARTNFEGKRSSEGAVAKRIIDEAKSMRESAQALVDELQARGDSLAQQTAALTQRRDALKTQLHLLADEKRAKGEGEAQVAAAAARVEQVRVALSEANLRLERMTIRAPIDGRVYQLVASPGSTLAGGMSPIANADGSTVVTLYRPDMLQARVDVRFADIPKVSLGQSVMINNPALDEPASGRVLFVSSEANIQKNTLEVKVALDEPVEVFKPEMLVEATYLAPKPAESNAGESQVTRLYAPRALIVRDDGGSYVWLADQSSGVARKTPITTGEAGIGGLVEVTAGLTPTSRIIARGHETLTDGARIRVVGEEADATASIRSDTFSKQPLQRLPQPGE
jgi:RND family efflux transporter MFP subunit